MEEAGLDQYSYLMDALNARDLEMVLPLYAADYEGVDCSDPTPQRGPEGALRMINRYRQAFPDLRCMPEQVIAQDDQVVVVWKANGTHRGQLLNIPPTGRSVTVQGVSVLTMQDGKIKRGLYLWDVAALLRSLGLLPELAQDDH